MINKRVRATLFDKLRDKIKAMDMTEVNVYFRKLPYAKVEKVSSGNKIVHFVGWPHTPDDGINRQVNYKIIGTREYGVQNFLLNALHERRDELYESS